MTLTEKKYKRFDLQNEEDYHIETFTEMKEWLADFWNFNPDEETTETEHENLIEEILNCSSEVELLDRLAGIGYSFEEVDPNKAPFKCPLCEADSMVYTEIKNINALEGVTHKWSCEDCPALLVEYYTQADIDAL